MTVRSFPASATVDVAESYERRVTRALTLWGLYLSIKGKGSDYFAKLMCALDDYNGSQEALNDCGERVTALVWLSVFTNYTQSSNDSISMNTSLEADLLKGLLKNRRWVKLFETAGTAHAFVYLAFSYIEKHAFPLIKPDGDEIREMLASEMSEWIGNGAPVEGNQLRDFAVALFGEPWCVVVYDGGPKNQSLAWLVANTKPEFLPGRLTSTPAESENPLPDLEFGENGASCGIGPFGVS
jgi:hypothetical protein